MARKLASVQRVLEVVPIEGADKIELVKVLGWQCVVKKGAFKPGDLGAYIEIDSIVPDRPVFEFMKERKFRVRSIKLRGALSQGLFMSFADLGITNTRKIKEDDDLTERIGVTKWEPPEDTGMIYQNKKPKSLWWKLVYTLPFLAMLRKKCGTGASFPSHLVPKTDETRIQNFGPDFLIKYADLPVAVSQKMDGSSTTFILNKGKFSVASRNVWMIEKNDSNFWRVAIETGIADAMKRVFGKKNICLQGEMCGPGIQGNKYNFDRLHYFLFGAFDSDKHIYLTPQELIDSFDALCLYEAKIEMVPQLILPGEGKCIYEIGTTVEAWLKFVETKSDFNSETWNEGVVVRSLDNKPYAVKGMEGGRFSFKVINNAFLLQYNL